MRKISIRNYLKAFFICMLFIFTLQTAFHTNTIQAATYRNKFVTINGTKYYYDSTGNRAVGWYTNSKGERYYFGTTGAIKAGFVTVNGKIYGFNTYGKMLTGWYKNSKGYYYYFDPQTGVRSRGITLINGKKYYFDPQYGYLRKGWYTSAAGNKYYFGTNGVITSGFKTIDSKKYYLNTNGRITRNSFVKYGSKTYYMNSAGLITKGRATIKGAFYAFDPKTGAMAVNAWYKENGTLYYATSNGKLATGVYRSGSDQSVVRYFNPSTGAMHTGWLNYRGYKYYFSKGSGRRLQDIIVNSNSKVYYFFQKNGTLAINKWVAKDGNKYYANSKGYLSLGVTKIGNYKYYFDSKAVMKTGWITIGTKTYYFKSNGQMAINEWINDKFLGSDGAYDKSKSAKYIWPLSSTYNTVTSYFGYRESPGGIGSTNHKGIDIPAPVNTPIYASAAGTIYVKQLPAQSGGAGNYIMIDHGNGIMTGYMHMNKFAPGIEVGTQVRKGQLIGYVGTTGNSTGYHLHLQFRINGVDVDPLKYVYKP